MVVLRGGLAVALLAVVAPAAAEPSKRECIEANDAGQDLRQAHKLSAAREQLLLCAVEACPGPVREDCAQRLREVDRAMPSIVFEVRDAAGNDLSAVRVSIDGQTLADSLDGTAISVDPGEHWFRFEVAGQPVLERELFVREGDKNWHKVIVLSIAAPATNVPSSLPAPLAPTRTSGPPLLSYVSFGAGGAGLVLGISAGVIANEKHSALQGVCNSITKTCAPQYAGDLGTFHSWMTVSTIGYVLSALGVAGGVTLWLTAPKVRGTTAQVWFGPGSAGIVGRF